MESSFLFASFTLAFLPAASPKQTPRSRGLPGKTPAQKKYTMRSFARNHHSLSYRRVHHRKTVHKFD